MSEKVTWLKSIFCGIKHRLYQHVILGSQSILGKSHYNKERFPLLCLPFDFKHCNPLLKKCLFKKKWHPLILLTGLAAGKAAAVFRRPCVCGRCSLGVRVIVCAFHFGSKMMLTALANPVSASANHPSQTAESNLQMQGSQNRSAKNIFRDYWWIAVFCA